MNQILFQYTPPADSQPYTAGTVPANKEWVISAITVTNLVKQDQWDTYAWVKYKIHIIKNWETPDQKNCLAYFPAYLPGESVHKYEGIRMSEWDYIVLYCNAWRVAIQAFGEVVADSTEPTYLAYLAKMTAMANSQIAWNTATQWCICP
jgi:hypothetical protein